MPGDRALTRSGRPFDVGKQRPVILATAIGPDAVLYPRSTRPGFQGGRFRHGPHNHMPDPPCKINEPGWVVLAVPVAVESRSLNDETYSCEEPEDSQLLDAIGEELRP